jgi:hypothetical protein
MPIPIEHIQERLSVAYVSAVVARAGFCFWPQPPTEYGTDGFIQRVQKLPSGSYRGTGDSVMIQIKSSITTEVRGTNVVYDMKIDAYNKLAEWEGENPCILVLFCMPRDMDHWLCHDEDSLVMKRCCYWMHIADPPSTNASGKTILIPRNQAFDINAVPHIFETFRKLKRVAV